MEEEQIAREEARKERQRQRDLDRLARRTELGSDLVEQRIDAPKAVNSGIASPEPKEDTEQKEADILRAEVGSLHNLTSTLTETISKLQVFGVSLQSGQDSLLSEISGVKQQLTTLRKLYDISVLDLEAEHTQTQRLNMELAEAQQDRDTAEDLASSQLEEIETLQETIKVL
jgi:chromosome segregation ATPase